MLVLDGQQRLQSLFIGLKGSYAGTDRELYFDVLSGDVVAPEDIRYRFAFIEKEGEGLQGNPSIYASGTGGS
jgi:outer membrane protease